MTRQETIEKVMQEFGKHGIERPAVAMAYDLAIHMNIPQDMIYSGMRMVVGNAVGVSIDEAAESCGKDFFESVTKDFLEENPDITEENLAEAMKLVGEEALNNAMEDTNFPAADIMKAAALVQAKEFMEEHCN